MDIFLSRFFCQCSDNMKRMRPRQVSRAKNPMEALVLETDTNILTDFASAFKNILSSMSSSNKEIGVAMKDASKNLASVSKLMDEEASVMKTKRLRDKILAIKEMIDEASDDKEKAELAKRLKKARTEYLDVE